MKAAQLLALLPSMLQGGREQGSHDAAPAWRCAWRQGRGSRVGDGAIPAPVPGRSGGRPSGAAAGRHAVLRADVYSYLGVEIMGTGGNNEHARPGLRDFHRGEPHDADRSAATTTTPLSRCWDIRACRSGRPCRRYVISLRNVPRLLLGAGASDRLLARRQGFAACAVQRFRLGSCGNSRGRPFGRYPHRNIASPARNGCDYLRRTASALRPDRDALAHVMSGTSSPRSPTPRPCGGPGDWRVVSRAVPMPLNRSRDSRRSCDAGASGAARRGEKPRSRRCRTNRCLPKCRSAFRRSRARHVPFHAALAPLVNGQAGTNRRATGIRLRHEAHRNPKKAWDALVATATHALVRVGLSGGHRSVDSRRLERAQVVAVGGREWLIRLRRSRPSTRSREEV